VTFDQFNIPSCPVSGVHFSPDCTRPNRQPHQLRASRNGLALQNPRRCRARPGHFARASQADTPARRPATGQDVEL